MDAQAIKAPLGALVRQLQRELGEQLTAVYLFGSYTQPFFQPGESDVNLLLLLTDDADLAAVRRVFLPLWTQHQSWLRRAPWLAHQSALARFIQLTPDFAQHLARHGRLLAGTPVDLSFAPFVDPHESRGRQATQALAASGAVLPSLLPEGEAPQRHTLLRRLARQLQQQPLPPGETAVQSFARVQYHLAANMRELPAARLWANSEVPLNTAPFLPGLQALYKQGSHIVMVLAHLSPRHIRATDWTQMTERLAGECKGLVLTTAVQLSLSLVYDNPLGLALKNYQHNWGFDPVAALQTSKRQMMRQAALKAATIALIELPQAYLTWPDGRQHDLIHDFQNRLLNLRLEYELLRRLGRLNTAELPAPLPDRETSPAQRVAAIWQQLAWWTRLYTTEMMQAEA